MCGNKMVPAPSAARCSPDYTEGRQQYQYLLTWAPHFLLLIVGVFLQRIDFHVSLKKSVLFYR
jgi:hypothetical protein